MKFVLPVAGFLLSFSTTAFAAFGFTNSGKNYVVDTGGGLIFSISKTNGDIVSLLYNNIQVQDRSKMSHIGSGLGSKVTSVAASTINSQYIKIQVNAGTLTHYYIAKVSFVFWIIVFPELGSD